MTKPSLYQIVGREVEPFTDLLKAVVEANWHLYLARERGWVVVFGVHEESGEITVSVEREDGWPFVDQTPEEEAAQ